MAFEGRTKRSVAAGDSTWSGWDGRFKLSQNRSAESAAHVVAALSERAPTLAAQRVVGLERQDKDTPLILIGAEGRDKLARTLRVW